jgi:hypothetical protein
MSRAFVLGNGVSRLAVNLDTLKREGKVYGCNALYRTFTPDVLVSTDTPISTAIQQSGYAEQNRMYTRKPIAGLGAYRVPQQYFGYSSGPIATALAALDQNIAVYLIGFDMGPIGHDKFNNVYANTEFYKKSSARPTFAGNWARQIVQIMRDFPKTNFFRVSGETTADIAEFRGVPNLVTMPMQDFLNRINNTKDL